MFDLHQFERELKLLSKKEKVALEKICEIFSDYSISEIQMVLRVLNQILKYTWLFQDNLLDEEDCLENEQSQHHSY